MLRAIASTIWNPPGIFSTVHGGGDGGLANALNSQASRLLSISDGGMEFDMPNGPTTRETRRNDTGDAVTTGLVLAAVVATFALFGPFLLKSDQKSVDVVAMQPTDSSPIKTP